MPSRRSPKQPAATAASRRATAPRRTRAPAPAAKPVRPAAKVTYVVLTWPGGRTRFQISSRSWAEGEGPQNRIREVLGRLTAGTWGVTDIVATIVAGLDGVEAPTSAEEELEKLLAACRVGFRGGETQTSRLIRLHVHARPLGESVPLAQAILVAALYGLPPKVADAAMTPEQLIEAALSASLGEPGARPNG